MLEYNCSKDKVNQLSKIILNPTFSINNMSVQIATKPKSQPRHIHSKNTSKGRYPDDFMPYYHLLRSVFASIKDMPEFQVFNIKYPVTVTLVYFFKSSRKSCISDIDNVGKPIMDALEASQIIQNDNMQYVSELHQKSLFDQNQDSFYLSLFHNHHA